MTQQEMATELTIQDLYAVNPTLYRLVFEAIPSSTKFKLNSRISYPYNEKNVVDINLARENIGYTCISTFGYHDDQVLRLVDKERNRLKDMERKISKVVIDFNKAHEKVLFEWEMSR